MQFVVIVCKKKNREKGKKKRNVNRCWSSHTKSKEYVNNDVEAGTSNQRDSKESNTAALSPSRKLVSNKQNVCNVV